METKLIKSMKTFILILSLVATCAQQGIFANVVHHEAWGAETNGIRMSIQLDENSLHGSTNKDVVLLFRLNNLTQNESFEIYHSFGFENGYDCSFEIISPSGKKQLLPAKHYSGSGAFIKIKPDQIREFTVNLSKLVQLNEAGTYQIIAEKVMVSPKSRKPFVVASNPLRVKIVVTN